MKLSLKAQEAINNRKVKLALAYALGFSELWINKLVSANKENGPLTTATAIEVIKKETGLDNILEESQDKAIA